MISIVFFQPCSPFENNVQGKRRTRPFPFFLNAKGVALHHFAQFPASARSENRTGLVEVSFTVNAKGHVGNVRADAGEKGNLLSEIVVVGYTNSTQETKGINETLKSECVRVVEGLGKFVPAEKDGKPVESVLVLPIRFKLN